jgi:hypothetical protein
MYPMRPRICRGEPPDIEAEHAHLAAVGWEQAQQGLDHRAFPGPIGAEQAHGAARKGGIDIAQRPLPAIADADTLEFDDRRHR